MNHAVSYETEQGRQKAGEDAHDALGRIEAHEQVCNVRHKYIGYRLNRLELLMISELMAVIGGMASIIYLLLGKVS